MTAHIGADTQHDHHRFAERHRHLLQIFDRLHNIIFLICLCCIRNQIVIPKILFRPF